MPGNGRIVVVAPNWLGDAVMALPAIADLRRHRPEAHLAVAARGGVAPLFTMVAGVDEVVTLQGKGGWRSLRSWRGDAAALGAGTFDTAVLLPNSFGSAWSASRASIAERWGFASDWRGRLLTRAVPRASGALHQAAYYQALMTGLGISSGPQHACVTVSDEAVGTALATAGLDPGAPFVVFAPGAAYGSAKQWLPERFAELGARVVRDLGWHVVLVGSRADASVCGEIVRRAGALAPAFLVNLAGRTNLAELAALLSRSRAVVANDSGAMHLAGAVGARVVAVFGATNEHRTSPLTQGADAPAPVILTHDAFCRPCMLRECPIDHRCMRGVTADRVFGALKPQALRLRQGFGGTGKP